MAVDAQLGGVCVVCDGGWGRWMGAPQWMGAGWLVEQVDGEWRDDGCRMNE